MAKVQLTIHGFGQISQEHGNDVDWMIAMAYFSVSVDGKPMGRYHADMKQAAGGEYQNDPIEVGNPVDGSEKEYKGPMNYTKYRRAIERCYRSSISSPQSGIRADSVGELENVSIAYDQPTVVEFEAD